eukprot:TRINITY_DN13971_c0_g2_i2.p1 TRINITY_DN13971_c0_g2~~TRINITY_DN13971_c0_g2_i2.p1  ORF type:complete len:197 (-),score=54.42 TRINITY_DN13971_c0_g2_i2:172-762(-)
MFAAQLVGAHRRCLPGAARLFSVQAAAPAASLQNSAHVSIRLKAAGQALKPAAAVLAGQFLRKHSASAQQSVGVGDRGAGLVYRDAGRVAAPDALKGKESAEAKQGLWVVKIQPPLDISSDSAGGIGKITPTTLLLSDRDGQFSSFVTEEEEGHFQLLKCALSEDDQVAYRYAETSSDGTLKVFTAERPAPAETAW